MAEPRVLVLGAGVTGLAAALYLESRSCPVTVLETGGRVGGRAARYACKATDRCLACGACLASDLVEAISSSRVIVHLDAVLVALEKSPPGWSASFRAGGGGLSRLACEAVLVATGLEPFDPAYLPALGYGRLPGVVGAAQLEEQLRAQGSFTVDEKPPRRVGFVQCAGSRHLQLGAGYCSEVCCKYGLRLALSLLDGQPGTEVTMFYMDLQTHGRGFDAVYHRAAERVQLVAGIPTEVKARPDGGLTVKYEDTRHAQVRYAELDALVLSQGIRPGRDTARLSAMLGLNCNADGFFAAGPSGATQRPGIYVAGAARGPAGIAQCVAQARAAAAEIAAMLEVDEL